jgi:type IV secretory pathway VirD2 relaxase
MALAEEGERRFADSPRAEERSALAIQALINLDRIGAARSRAYKFLARYPDGAYSAQVAATTGVHPTPVGPGEHP